MMEAAFAEAILPGAQLLLDGRYAEAWPIHDERSHRKAIFGPLSSRCREWRGEDLAGKSVLLWGEQGIGDEVMFARFLSSVRSRGPAQVTVGCNPVNARLFLALGADAVVNRMQQHVSLPPVLDYWVMLGSLPRWLGIDFSNVPGAPYIGISATAPRGIGVAWRGNPRHLSDHLRSLPSGAPLLTLPGARELAPDGDTINSLAQLAECELVITVDTSWAHLAGAIGKPTWVLLPKHEGLDWRWGRSGTTSPWYRTHRLFRQHVDGDWTGVLDEVRAALSAL